MKKNLLAFLCSIFIIPAYAQDCSDLFISEYVVGSANNRALEIYNPTNEAISLSGYQVGRFRDGAQVPMLLDLHGTVPSYGTFVIVVDKRDPNGTGFEEPVDMELQALADTFVNPVYVQTNSPFYFNGDDAVVLTKGPTVMMDLMGRIGEDPGTAWADSNGTWWTSNKTLVRKATVLKGVQASPAVFEVQVEWDSLPNNTFTMLGQHECDCEDLIGIEDDLTNTFTMYPNPVTDGSMLIKATDKFSELKIYNVIGQQVKRFVSDEPRNYMNLQLDELKKGVYLISLELLNKEIITRKIIIQN